MNGNCVEGFDTGLVVTVRNDDLSVERKRKKGRSEIGGGHNPKRVPHITKFNISTHHDGNTLRRDDYVTTHVSVYRDDHRLVRPPAWVVWQVSGTPRRGDTDVAA